MQMFHRWYDLPRIVRTHALFKSAQLIHPFVEFPQWGVLHDHVDSFLIKEKSIQFEDVLVLEMAMDFDLSSELTDYVWVY